MPAVTPPNDRREPMPGPAPRLTKPGQATGPTAPGQATGPTAPESDLGSSELEVLRTLWDEGPATVRDVMNVLHGQGRKLAYTTVLTFLTRLEQKGYVVSDKTGVAYVYRACVTRDSVSSSRLRSLLEELYDGAAGPLVLQLVEEESLTDEEISALQKLIERLDAKQRTKAARGGRAARRDGGAA